MKIYTLALFIAAASVQPSQATTAPATAVLQTQNNTDLLGKYIVVQEKTIIRKDGKIIDSSEELVEDGIIYHFKSAKLVTVFWEANTKGINFEINKDGNKIELINKSGEAEDDELSILRNDKGLFLIRSFTDADEDGDEIVGESIFKLKAIK